MAHVNIARDPAADPCIMIIVTLLCGLDMDMAADVSAGPGPRPYL